MQNTHMLNTRRQFLQSLGFGAATLGLLSSFSVTAALEQNELSFRQGAKPLLLHFNENSLGMSPKALAAAKDAIVSAGNRYPDDMYEKLKSQLARFHEIEPKQLMFGNGSTEVLQAIATYAADLGTVVIEPTPTFGALRRYCNAEGLKVVRVPVGNGFEIDIAAMKKQASAQSGSVLINLCNPNNPTGTIVEAKQLYDWIANAPENHLFLVDEAYYDYAQANPSYASALPLIKQGNNNVIITRTFSKAYGMAGMRIGYGIATKEMAEKINPYAAGFNLNAAGIAAASASLDDHPFYQSSIESNLIAKKILTTTLDELKLNYIPSNTNFVLHRIGQPIDTYAQHMRQNGIRVGRKMTQDENWNRLSIGTPEEMKQFSQTLIAFRRKGWV